MGWPSAGKGPSDNPPGVHTRVASSATPAQSHPPLCKQENKEPSSMLPRTFNIPIIRKAKACRTASSANPAQQSAPEANWEENPAPCRQCCY
eukprot:1140877-Pelagomonas_calceolata.AAC.5